MNVFVKSLATAGALLLAATAQAAVVFTPSGPLNQDHDAGAPVSLGNVFTAQANTRVDSLGFYTPTNLVGGGETVALYDIGGTLLASTFVDVPVNTPGQYFFEAITPVLLTGGQQYVVVNFVGQNAWAFGTVTTTNATFNYNAYSYGPALAFPTSTGGSGPAYLGPNLSITSVPEPATWGMIMLGLGMVGFGLRRRKNTVTTRVTFA